jgi:hypothetical protein
MAGRRDRRVGECGSAARHAVNKETLYHNNMQRLVLVQVLMFC